MTDIPVLVARFTDPARVQALNDDDLKLVEAILGGWYEAPERPGLQPHQIPPPLPWWTWLFLAGRGAGKTQACSVHFYDHATGPPCDPTIPGGHRMAIVGPTLGDVASSCFDGPSGLLKLDPTLRMVTRRGGTFIDFANGVNAKCLGGQNRRDANRLRAHGNTCMVWLEEAAAIEALAHVWDQVQLSMRLGAHPRAIASTTPARRAALKTIINDPGTAVTHARMADNVYLTEEFKARQYERYKGTRIERQELEGLMLDDTPGALWTTEDVDARRLNEAELRATHPPTDQTREQWLRDALDLTTVYVSVDPATSGRGDRTGLVVVGGDNPKTHPDGKRHAYILEDLTARMVPSTVDLGEALGDDELEPGIQGWADVAAATAYRWQANAILVERNRLGRTALAVIRAAGFDGRIVEVDAKDSKANRADPVRAAWPRRCWLVGAAALLEAEMTTWVPAEGDIPDDASSVDASRDGFTGSPDALDAMVHAVRHLLGIGRARRAASRPLGDALVQGWS